MGLLLRLQVLQVRRRYWLLLKFIDVSMGIVNLKDKVVNLLLEELDNSVMLSDYGITH
jgi:hypothetical protein